MTEQETRQNILLYRIFALFDESLFWGAILVLSVQQLGHMSLEELYYCEAVVLCLCVLLDIPCGALADTIGRKRMLIMARVLLFADMCLFAFMHNTFMVWLANIIWAIGYSLQSGADSSLLYETLKESGRESEYKRIQGRAIGSRLILVACCSLVVGYLAQFNLRYPLMLSIPFMLIPLIAVCLMKEPRQVETYSAQKQWQTLKEGVRFLARSKEVRWMAGFAALIAATSKIWFFTYNPYFELVGVPVAQFGVIFFLLNIVAWLSSHYAHTIEQVLGERGCVLGAVMLIALPIVLMALFPIHPFAYLVLLQNIVRGFMHPFKEAYIHHHISGSENGSNIRATVMSAQSSASFLASIVGLALFGILTARMSLTYSLLVLGIVFAVLGTLSYRSYVRNNR